MKKTCLIVVLFFAGSLAHADDPFAGVWVMKASASKYTGERPKVMRIVMESTPGGVHYRSETTHANDRITIAEYSADYEGSLALVTGTGGVLPPVMLKRVDANTVKASYLRGLQVVATSTRVLSRHGDVMTITTTSNNSEGHVVTNIGVYGRKGQ